MSSTRLPWDIQEFKRSDLTFVAVAAVLCVAIPFIKVPLPEPKVLPERVVILPPVAVEPPPVVAPEPTPVAEPLPEPIPEPVPEPVKPVVQPKPEPVRPVVQPRPEPRPVAPPPPPPQATAVQPKPAPVAPPQPTQAELRAAAQQRARDAVKDTGLTSAIGSLSNTPSSPSSRPVTSNAAQASTSNTTGLKTSASQTTQSNLQVARASTDKPVVAGSLSDRKSADVSQAQIKDQARSTPATASSTGSAKSGRNDVDRVINQAKGRLQAAYQRALDDDPTMEGNVVVRLRIKPDGTVTSVSIVSSALNNKELEDKFLAILRGLKFSDGDFEEWNNTYTLNFLPL